MGRTLEPRNAVLGRMITVNSHIEYHRPSSLMEACSLLSELGPDAAPRAGGTDVLVDLHRGATCPVHLVSLSGIRELDHITVQKGMLRMGALVTPNRIGTSEEVRVGRPELLDAVGGFGTPQVRNRATLGGNLCTAASCGDLPPLLVALGARAILVGLERSRELPLEDLFLDHRRTALLSGEILREVTVPLRGPGEGAGYETFGRRAANFITVAGVAVWLRLEGDSCAAVRVALGAVSPTPVRAPEAEGVLVGSRLEEEVVREAAMAARRAAVPISDVRGSAEHRRELVEALMARAVEKARERAGKGAAG